jgi:hypothetical protein
MNPDTSQPNSDLHRLLATRTRRTADEIMVTTASGPRVYVADLVITPDTSALADEPIAEIVVPEDAASVAPGNYLLLSWFYERHPATNGMNLKLDHKSFAENNKK